MSEKNLHNDLKEESGKFFSRGEIQWEKSGDEVWEEMAAKMESPRSGKKIFLTRFVRYAAAAVIVLAVALGAVTFLYQRTITTQPGEQLVAELPDGSQVELNAASVMKYHPLKWNFNRAVKLKGEALFKVKKGRNFAVVSEFGTTHVLGTSFNIFARDENYRVTCLTGKVKVTSKSDESVILFPNTQVVLQNGKLILKEGINTENAVDWLNNRFFFPGTPLKEVFDEIERRYGVTIKLPVTQEKRNFVGNFQKMFNVEEVLDFVCKSMQIQYKKQSENVFLIQEKS